jgi:hypothetical protein
MSPLPDLSNEQKLTYIYHTLKDQESRRKRTMVYRLFKWLILVGIVYLIVTYPAQIFGKISELIRPVIMDQAQSVLDENRTTINRNLNILFKNIKTLLDESIGDATIVTPVATPIEVVKPTPTKTSPAKTTTPVKKGAPI